MIFNLKIFNDENDELIREFAKVNVILGTGHGQAAVALLDKQIVANLSTWDDNPVQISLGSIRIDGYLQHIGELDGHAGYWLLSTAKA